MDAKYLKQGDPVNIGVFVVDDDFDLLEQIKEIIEQLGITNYHLFHNEQDFLDGLTDNIHVCILDHYLPVKTGLDVLTEIKKKNNFSYVIAYTGVEDKNIIIDYLNGGCDKFVRKNEAKPLEKLTEFLKEGLIVAKKNVDYDNSLKEILARKQKELEMESAP